jgi:hypothetical protein
MTTSQVISTVLASYEMAKVELRSSSGKLQAGKRHEQLCVQQRLACSVGAFISPTEAKVRSLVAWIARRKEN